MLYTTKSHFNVPHNLPSSRTEIIPVRIYFKLAMTIANSESPSPDQNAVHSLASDRELPRSLGTKQADQVSHSAIGRTAKRGTTVASRLASKCVEFAETFLNKIPKFRAAWRAKAFYKAARLLLDEGGTDLAAALDMTAIGDLKSVHGGEEIDHSVHVEDVKPGMADRDRRRSGHDGPFDFPAPHEFIASEAVSRTLLGNRFSGPWRRPIIAS